MKTLTKIMLCALLLSSIVFTACSAKNPPVTENQMVVALQEMNEAEANVTALQQENTQLQSELDNLKAKRDALQRIADGNH